jgi:hypothetical protein
MDQRTSLMWTLKRAHIGFLRFMHIVILAQSCSLLLEFLLTVSELGKRSGCSLFVSCEPLKSLTLLDRKDAGLCLSKNPNP